MTVRLPHDCRMKCISRLFRSFVALGYLICVLRDSYASAVKVRDCVYVCVCVCVDRVYTVPATHSCLVLPRPQSEYQNSGLKIAVKGLYLGSRTLCFIAAVLCYS